MSRPNFTAIAVLSLSAASVLHADPTGTLDTSVYGTVPATVQVNPTGFGDAPGGQVDAAGGSELDAAYGRVLNGSLYLFFAGNIESNFNHLEIFIDANNGTGVNTLPHNSVDIDFRALDRMGANPDNTDPNEPASNTIGKGLTFDGGFNAGYYFGAATGGGTQFYINYATLTAAGNGVGSGAGGTGTSAFDANTGIKAALNDSNGGGVTGATADPAAAAAVNTGVEFQIPLSALGNPTKALKVTAFINGGGHDFVSNQILGSLPSGYGNMGEPRNLDFSTVSGDQFFVVHVIPGDANDDGRINGDDYALTDRGRAGGLTGWANGDFNNDGQVNGADYLLLDTSYFQQGGAPSAGFLAARDAEFGNAYVASLLAAVPEPTGVALVGALVAASRLGRRRRA